MSTLAEAVSATPDLADDGGVMSPTVPRPMAPRQVFESFSAADTIQKVEGGLSSAASSVSTAAQTLWSKVTGKNDVAANVTLPTVQVTGKSSSGDSLTWLWLFLAAGVAFLVYHFWPKGRRGGKSILNRRASGSVVKFRGK